MNPGGFRPGAGRPSLGLTPEEMAARQRRLRAEQEAWDRELRNPVSDRARLEARHAKERAKLLARHAEEVATFDARHKAQMAIVLNLFVRAHSV